jgi:hypothetical protein
MNDMELDELLNQWSAPAPSGSLRKSVMAGFRAERKPWRWTWGKSLLAGAAMALLLIVTAAVPQTTPVHRPYTVLSEFVRYAEDGSSSVVMYSTSYNDANGREIILARHLPGDAMDLLARTLDAFNRVTLPARLNLLRMSPGGAEMLARRAAVGPSPMVTTECFLFTDRTGIPSGSPCLSVASYTLPRASANAAAGCVDGAAVDRETILGYSTAAIQSPLDGNRRRRTVWMAPALGCFALKVATEEERSDGSFRLVSGKQAVGVRLAP